MRKAWLKLRPEGHLVLHITDVFRTQVCEPLLLYGLGYLPNCVYRGVLASLATEASQRPRPMWVLQKVTDAEFRRYDNSSQARDDLAVSPRLTR